MVARVVAGYPEWECRARAQCRGCPWRPGRRAHGRARRSATAARHVVVRVVVRGDLPGAAAVLRERVHVAIARLLSCAVAVRRAPRLERGRARAGAADADRTPLDADQLDVGHTVGLQVLVGLNLRLVEVGGRRVGHDRRVAAGEGLHLLLVAALNHLLNRLLGRVGRRLWINGLAGSVGSGHRADPRA